MPLAATDSTAGWRDLIVPTNPTEFWTVVVAVLAAAGLVSVWLLKKDMRNRTTREAAQTTIDRCEEMGRVLIPLYSEIRMEMQRQKLSLFLTDPDKISFEKTEEANKINGAIAWLGRLDDATREKTVDLLNLMEVWSMSFTHDPALANQKVAFEPCSTVFCQMVVTLYPMLLTQRRLNPDSGPYQNVVTLFKGWYKQQAQGKLMEQLLRLQAGAALPRPIS